MKIGRKLNLTHALMAAFVLVLIIGANNVMHSLEQDFGALAEQTLEVTRELENLRAAGLRIVASTAEYALLAHSGDETPLKLDQDSGEAEGEVFPQEELELEQGVDLYEASIERYSPIVERFFPDEASYRDTISDSGTALIAGSRSLIGLIQKGISRNELLEEKERLETIEQAYLTAISSARDHELEEFQERKERIREAISNAAILAWVGFGIVAATMLLIGRLVTRSITRALHTLTEATEQFGRGDFSARLGLELPGELGTLAKAYNRMGDDLGSEMAARERVEEQVKASLLEKEELLKEIHHRVKNNLQVISSMLSLQANIATDAQIVDALGDSQRRINVMARIHNSLLLSDDLASINTRDYLNNLVDDMKLSYALDMGRISVSTDVDEIFLDAEHAIYYGQIVSELLANCVKHAFPNGRLGRSEVSLHRLGEGRIELVVADNGIGLPEGFDWIGVKSLGLRIVRALVDKMHGVLTIDGSRGTRVQIVFPEHQS